MAQTEFVSSAHATRSEFHSLLAWAKIDWPIGKMFIIYGTNYPVIGLVTGMAMIDGCLALYVSVPEYGDLKLEHLIYSNRQWKVVVPIRKWSKRNPPSDEAMDRLIAERFIPVKFELLQDEDHLEEKEI